VKSKFTSINQVPNSIVKFCLPAGTGEGQRVLVDDGKTRVSQRMKQRFVDGGFDQDYLVWSDLCNLFNQLGSR